MMDKDLELSFFIVFFLFWSSSQLKKILICHLKKICQQNNLLPKCTLTSAIKYNKTK